MKRLFIIILIILSHDLLAQDEIFRILYINTPTINIGGKTLSVGHEFNSSDEIDWTSDKQAIRVISLLTQRQYTLCSKSISGRRSLSAFLKSNKTLATRPGQSSSLVTLSQIIPSEIYLLDKVEFHTSIPVDEKHFFYASYHKDGEIINKKLNALPQGGFILDQGIWQIDGVSYTPHTIRISLHYYDTVKNIVTDIAEDICLIPLSL